MSQESGENIQQVTGVWVFLNLCAVQRMSTMVVCGTSLQPHLHNPGAIPTPGSGDLQPLIFSLLHPGYQDEVGTEVAVLMFFH